MAASLPEVVVDAPPALAAAFTERFTAAARAAIAARGRFACALPGGSVGETFFPRLAVAPLAARSGPPVAVFVDPAAAGLLARRG